MTEQEYTTQPETKKWELIALYQKKKKVFMVDINVKENMDRFFEWLKLNYK